MNWADLGVTWPTPTSGTLGTFPFTTTPGFNANTNACWVDDTSGGAPARSITGSAVLQFTVSPAVSIAAAPTSINDALTNNVSTVTVTSSQVAAAGGLAVNLTPPPVNARYGTTCGSTITITAGSTTATCTVTATNNTVAGDGNVNAPVTITAGAGYTITGVNPAVVTIVDDDVPVISAVCAPTTLTDSASQISTCTISSDKALVSPLTVTLTPPAASGRYTTTCVSTIIIPAGAAGTSNTCTISAVANTALGDGNVTASLSVAAGSGYSVGGSAQNVAVNNDDLATIGVAVSPASVAENSGTAMVYTFTASAASPSATSIVFTPPAASGRYSTTCVSPISLPASATTATCSVTPIDNTALDGSATATVTLLPSAGVYTVGAPSVATGTITDDEIGVGVVATTAAIGEGGNAVFTISCQGVATVTVNYSFSGTYSPLPANGSQSLTCGTPLVVTVPTIDDAVQNGTRTLTLTISSVGQPGAVNPANASATVTVLDNDVPKIIPTMSTLGLMLLGLLLAAAAGFGIRRKA